jgi:1-acyl-sn-glycerol-3-phosphate acyltransferase
MSSPPILPRERLRPVERLVVTILDGVNLRDGVKDVIQWGVRAISARWIRAATTNLVTLRGLEHVRDLRPPRGVILVSNHRSFFDMYATCAYLYRESSFLRRLYFPVRSTFWYENPLGLLVNLGISGGAMWPPIFRDARRTTLNPRGLEQMRYVLARPGAVLGIHPEGTRGKGDDPYALLPAKPGLGELVATADDDVLIVPFFVIGLQNAFVSQVASNFGIGRRTPFRVRFGAPLTAAEARALGDSPAAVSKAVFARVAALAEEDRAESAAR